MQQAEPAAPARAAAPRALPILNGVLPIDPSRVPTEVLAGITLAALAIPEVMGYTSIAGMPVITGLYTILLPIAVFAILGSSRHLVVGADSATAAIMAAGVAPLAASGSPEYVGLAGMLALMTGGLLVLARLVRLGFLADFLSRAVLVGFLTGVGVQVAMGQVAEMLGVPGGGHGTIDKFLTALSQVPQANIATVEVSAAVLAVILGMRLVSRRIPGALIAVVGAIAASYFLNLSADGVAVLGTVPGGLPRVGVPQGNLNDMGALAATSFSLFLVILAQSAATSRAYGAKYNEEVDENQDLVALGLANASAGLTGTFVVNGSPTKSQMVDSAGGRSQLPMLITAVVVLVVLLFLTAPLAYMPKAVLASVVFLIGVELVDIAGMRHVLRARPWEFGVAAITGLVVVVVGVEQAIILAIILSLLNHTRHGYRPKSTLLATQADGRYHPEPLDSGAQLRPGLMVYRFPHDMYYANAQRMSSDVVELVREPKRALRLFTLDLGAVDDVDYTSGATMVQLADHLKERDIRMAVLAAEPHVRHELDRSGLTEKIGEQAYFDHVSALVERYDQEQQPASTT